MAEFSVDYEKKKRPSMHFMISLGWVNATLLQLAFLGESDPHFHLDNKV